MHYSDSTYSVHVKLHEKFGMKNPLEVAIVFAFFGGTDSSLYSWKRGKL